MIRSFRLINSLSPLKNIRYLSSGSSDLLSISTNNNGISTLTMNSRPVNSLSLDFLKDFCEKMDYLEKQQVKGVILTSVSFYNMIFINKLMNSHILRE
jgi:hypothetical protein